MARGGWVGSGRVGVQFVAFAFLLSWQLHSCDSHVSTPAPPTSFLDATVCVRDIWRRHREARRRQYSVNLCAISVRYLVIPSNALDERRGLRRGVKDERCERFILREITSVSQSPCLLVDGLINPLRPSTRFSQRSARCGHSLPERAFHLRRTGI